MSTWVGRDFGPAKPTVTVKCVRIYQNPNKFQRSVHLGRWDGATWAVTHTFGVLTGDNWNRRPAGARQMWRVSNAEYT